jgi:hypothetical protein
MLAPPRAGLKPQRTTSISNACSADCKEGDWLGWDPLHHWTDRKIRIHAFYCMMGISLLHHLHQQAQAGSADLSLEQLLEELAEIKQFVLLYPTQGEKGPARTAYVLSQQTLAQQDLVKTRSLERLHRSTHW